MSEEWPWLEAWGIESATTCELGLNDARTPRYRLRRPLDAETVRPIESEAETSGIAEPARRAVSLPGRRDPSSIQGRNPDH